MIESILVVLSRALPGREEEMSDWYTNVHLRNALRYRGSLAVQRFTAAEDQPGPLPAGWPWQYLALYEAYSAELFTQAHRDAADTVWMHISEAFDASMINDFYYYPMIWRSNAIDQVHQGGVILEQFVVQFGIIGDAGGQQILVCFQIIDQNIVILFRRNAGDNCGGHFAARRFDIHDFARIGADDGATVEVVKAFPSGRANAFGTPFRIGHGDPLSG